MILRTKKSSERVLSLFWLFVLIVIGVFVCGGVILFYSSEQDVRKLESEILASRVVDCLSENGQLSLELSDDKEILKSNLLEKCKLNEQVFIENDIYLGLGFYNENHGLDYTISIGDAGYAVYCGVEAKEDLECTEENLVVFSGEERLRVNILAVSSNKGSTI